MEITCVPTGGPHTACRIITHTVKLLFLMESIVVCGKGFFLQCFFIDAGLALGYLGRSISGDGTAHVSVTGITTANHEGQGLVCVATSRDTGTAPRVSLDWYRDGIKLQRQGASSLQSYLGWHTYYEFKFNRRIWLKRDADIVATEGVFFCHIGRSAPFLATVSVGVYYPSECGYALLDMHHMLDRPVLTKKEGWS